MLYLRDAKSNKSIKQLIKVISHIASGTRTAAWRISERLLELRDSSREDSYF